jgi:hypothetical protein
MNSERILNSSFRDPCGFLFSRDGALYRQVNTVYSAAYDHLMVSGLYETLVDRKLLIPHVESDVPPEIPETAYKIIRPEELPFISYPHEWCFSQLKDAALLTIDIQKTAIEHGMTLKDASAYNVQFRSGKAIFIDTLSFDIYSEGSPWVAYRQFCQHFVAPLALMSLKDVRLNQLFITNIDGVPLDLASELLPSRTFFNFSLLTHIHLHAKSQKRYADKADKAAKTSGHKISKFGFLGLIGSLGGAVRKLSWKPAGTEWADYYEATNYSSGAQEHKKQLVSEFLDELSPKSVWDLGANTGVFSRIASGKGILTMSFDIDPAAVEMNYLECGKNNETGILPLIMDLTNPSPDIGWQNRERTSFIHRGPADTVMALALIHHLAISNNVPLARVASFFAGICSTLIIEFVPKNDSQVQRLLASREDIFPDYTQEAFERAFSEFFIIRKSERLRESERTLYMMRKDGS